MPKQNNRQIGSIKEALAAAYLKQNNVEILETNFRSRCGEIDLIGRDGNYIVFFEVKYRKDMKFGGPFYAVGQRKQKVICRVSDYYRLCRSVSPNKAIRYDVIGISGEEITWIKNAFYYQGY